MHRLRATILSWSLQAEALIVVVGAFGYALVSTTGYLLGIRRGAPITERHLEFLLIYEPATLLVLGGFLFVRGWTPQRIGLTVRLTDPLAGICLAIGSYAAISAVWMLATAAKLQPSYLRGATTLIGGHFALPIVVATCIVNGLFEELFVCGYIIAAAKERGRAVLGVNASIAIRLAYHLYQGSNAVVAIVPLGLIFALWYARTNRLLPLVLAHGLIDFIGLVRFVN